MGVIAFDADIAERWAKESSAAGHHGPPGDQAGRRARHAGGEGAPDQPRRTHQPRGARRPPVRQAGGGRRGGARDRPRVAHDAGRRRGPSPKATGSRSTAPRERSSPASSPRSCPDLKDPYLLKLLAWADTERRLQVWANADYPADARRAREYGAQGIGLCRTEHMFFETERMPVVQRMILAKDDPAVVAECLADPAAASARGLLRPLQGDGRAAGDRAPDRSAAARVPPRPPRGRDGGREARGVRRRIRRLWPRGASVLTAIERLHESNPMLGLRGVRLGIHMAALTRMQVRAIFEAACRAASEGVDVHPEVMIPLAGHWRELEVQQQALEEEAEKVMAEQGRRVSYKFGTMIEIPRAALTADELARFAQFFSFGTNDLTQMTFGISRDDAEKGFLLEYLAKAILPGEPVRLDRRGGRRQAHEDGGRARPDDPPGNGDRHLRRARRRPEVDRLLPRDRPRLRLLLPLPHPHRPPRRRPGGAAGARSFGLRAPGARLGGEIEERPGLVSEDAGAGAGRRQRPRWLRRSRDFSPTAGGISAASAGRGISWRWRSSSASSRSRRCRALLVGLADHRRDDLRARLRRESPTDVRRTRLRATYYPAAFAYLGAPPHPRARGRRGASPVPLVSAWAARL